MTTPAITLTATLEDLTGAQAGSTANPAKMRLTLCNYGPVLPCIANGAAIAVTAITFATPSVTLAGSFPTYNANWIGDLFKVAGDTAHTGNNGYFVCTGGSTSTLILTNSAGVTEVSPIGVTVTPIGCMLARTGPMDILSSGAAISTPIWGNDQITPAGTYYNVEILDGEDNVVQSGAYQFTGSGTQDLNSAAQIVGPGPAGLPNLQDLPCTGSGTSWTAPGTAVAVFYNGVKLPPNQSLPILSYTVSGGTAITLNFSPGAGEEIYALCIVT